jgi:hypothetical protein
MQIDRAVKNHYAISPEINSGAILCEKKSGDKSAGMENSSAGASIKSLFEKQGPGKISRIARCSIIIYENPPLSLKLWGG